MKNQLPLATVSAVLVRPAAGRPACYLGEVGEGPSDAEADADAVRPPLERPAQLDADEESTRVHEEGHHYDEHHGSPGELELCHPHGTTTSDFSSLGYRSIYMVELDAGRSNKLSINSI